MITLIYFGSSVVYSWADNGLADLMGLETLRHGTNPYNNLCIRINGGDPNHGGKSTGGTPEDHYDKENVKNHFYLFKDSEKSHSVQDQMPPSTALLWISRYLYIPLFKGLSGGWARILKCKSEGGVFIKKENGTASNILLAISGLASCLISSTLHFRFASIDKNRLDDDSEFAIAYRTQQKVEWWRIGFFGSLVVASTADRSWLARIKQNPHKMAWGLTKLTAAAAACVLAAPVVMSSTPLMAAAVAGAFIS